MGDGRESAGNVSTFFIKEDLWLSEHSIPGVLHLNQKLVMATGFEWLAQADKLWAQIWKESNISFWLLERNDLLKNMKQEI